MNRTFLTLAVAACALLGLARGAQAGTHDGCCGQVSACPTDCGSPCPTDCGHKVCEKVPDVRKWEHRDYGDKYEDFCLPCSVWGMLTHSCDCSKVHCRKQLVVRIRKCEEPTTKCVVAIKEPCASHCPCPTGGCSIEVHHAAPAAPMMAPPPGMTMVPPAVPAPVVQQPVINGPAANNMPSSPYSAPMVPPARLPSGR
jgi:hypothetical protein